MSQHGMHNEKDRLLEEQGTALHGAGTEQAKSPSREANGHPTARSYGADYFATLYGDMPAQTIADKLRDRLIRRLVYSYSYGGSLLEIGCGFGYLLDLFDDRFIRHGTDISAHAIAAARRRLPDAALVVADIQDGVPFRGPFDTVVAVNVMEHLPHRAGRLRRSPAISGRAASLWPICLRLAARWRAGSTHAAMPATAPMSTVLQVRLSARSSRVQAFASSGQCISRSGLARSGAGSVRIRHSWPSSRVSDEQCY